MHTTSPTLLNELRRPNPTSAWERFTKLYTPLLYEWARRHGLSEADASDLVQEVFVVLVTTIPTFRYDQHGSFRGWLWTVTINKHRELIRRKRPLAVDNLDDLPAADDPLADEVIYRRRLVQEMFLLLKSEFPPSIWQIFQEYVVQQMDPRAIAVRRKVTVGTIYAAKSKVLQRIRKELAGLVE